MTEEESGLRLPTGRLLLRASTPGLAVVATAAVPRAKRDPAIPEGEGQLLREAVPGLVPVREELAGVSSESALAVHS